MSRTMTKLVSDLRTDLGDVGTTERIWSQDELERSINRAISDLSRYLPDEATTDITLTALLIKDKVSLDISTLAGLIRVRRIEYPTGQVPQSFCQYDIFGDYLYIVGMGEGSGQESLSIGQKLRIYYDTYHTIPTPTAAGSIPPFLEDTVLQAAAAYSLFQRAVKLGHVVKEDIDAARSALGAASTALNKVATYLENNTGEDAKGWLTKITTDIASLRTAITTSLDALNTYLDAVAGDATAADGIRNSYIGTVNYVDGASAPSIKKYLTDAATSLANVNAGGEGQEVPNTYRSFSQTTRDGLVAAHERDREFLAGNATLRTNAAMIYAQESAQRLSNLRSYIEQAEAWGRIASGFVAEAQQRIADAAQYISVISGGLALMERIHNEATDRRNEVWSIWRDRTQLIGDFAQASMRQMAG